MSRTKDSEVHLRLSKAERERIEAKMQQVGVKNMSAYIRKMAMDGYCVNLDLKDVREMVSLLRRCSNNLNQYAKKANQTGSIYAADVEDLRQRLDDIWKQSAKVMETIAKIT